jgi:hypothetical protein
LDHLRRYPCNVINTYQWLSDERFVLTNKGHKKFQDTISAMNRIIYLYIYIFIYKTWNVYVCNWMFSYIWMFKFKWIWQFLYVCWGNLYGNYAFITFLKRQFCTIN